MVLLLKILDFFSGFEPSPLALGSIPLPKNMNFEKESTPARMQGVKLLERD